jgi:hypothetical protein
MTQATAPVTQAMAPETQAMAPETQAMAPVTRATAPGEQERPGYLTRLPLARQRAGGSCSVVAGVRSLNSA